MKKLITLIAFMFALPGIAQVGSYLVGLKIDSSQVKTRYMNTANGAITNLANTSANAIVQGESTYDAAGSRYFVIMNFPSNNSRIAVINALTGQVTATVANTTPVNSLEYNSNTGALLGVYWNGTNRVFVSINISTGVVTSIAVIPGAQGIVQGESSFDAAGNRYFMRSTSGLMVINATTGAVINTFTANLSSMEYNPNTGALVGMYWNGSNEVYASMNLTTGAVTNVATLTGVQSIIQGESTFDASGNRYFSRTNFGTMVINATNGSVFNAFPGTSTINSIEYIGSASVPCNLSISISPSQYYGTTGSTAMFTASSNMQNTTYQWQSNPAQFGWLNVSNNGTYSGAGSSVLSVSNLGLQNHLQPFKVLATAGSCTAISNVATIHITDTCVVNDTTFTSLKISGAGKGSFIRIYPNPSSDVITIDNGSAQGMDVYSITILNTLGQVVYTRKVTQGNYRVSVSELGGKGVYFVQLADPSDKLSGTGKIIVE